MPPPLFASATATRLAAHWVVDALAGDETLDFSMLKALVSTLPECLTGAPDATRERVALRCLQEVASVAPEGGAAATAGVLRVDAARSCEDSLLELIGKVGHSGTLDKNMLAPFSQDIQNIICVKKSTLPETLFELLKEVDPEIASMVPPSRLEQNGSNKLENDQSLCSSHDHVNKDNAEFLQETSANLIDGTESRNLEKDPIAMAFVLHQPCTSHSKSYDHLQEDDAGAAGSGARPQDPETSIAVDENVPLGTVHASAGCDTTLQGCTAGPLWKKEMEVRAAIDQPQSPKKQYPNASPHHVDEERLHDDGPRDLSLKPINEGLDTDASEASTLDRTSNALPKNSSEPGQLHESVTQEDMTRILQPHRSRTDTNVLQHQSGDEVNLVFDDVSANFQPMDKNHVQEELTVQGASALPSVSCNDAIQGGQSKTNHPTGNAPEHTTVFEGQIGDKSHIEFSGADKLNESLHDDARILEKTTVHGGLHVQATSLSQNYNLALHDKIAEAQNTGKSRINVQENSCSTSVPNILQDGTGTRTTNTSNKRNLEDISAEMRHVSSSYDSLHRIAASGLLSMTNKMLFGTKNQEMNDALEGLSQQDLCIKCGKVGQLLKCSGCSLAAHDSCFGLSVTFQESDLFYCPVCFYTKATEAYQKAKKAYCEARKNLATFLGTIQVVEQHDDLSAGVLPRAPNREVSDSSKRKNAHQHEGANLVRDEEPDQQRKKHKVYVTGHGCPEEIVTEKASPVQNSNIAIMNKHSVLKDNSIIQDAEQQQQGEKKEAGNGNLSHETRCSSHNRCGSHVNQEVEADKEYGSTKSYQSNDSDEIEATSSNDSGRRSSPLWRKMKHSKSRLLEKETVASSNSRKTVVQQDQHMSSPSRKRNCAAQKRYSNPAAPTGRRSKLSWTEEEESTLKEAMAKFARQDNGPIPWVQMLEYGRDVFHKTRLPCDLRVKWRNIMKKTSS